MNRLQTTLTLVCLIGVPAAAHSFFAGTKNVCFAAGTATYRLSQDTANPDYRVRVDNEAVKADLHIQLVDRAEIADFVMVDDVDAAPTDLCRNATAVKTITLDDATLSPDVTVQLSADALQADYKIYVHSARYSHQDAAALLAVMWKAEQKRTLAAAQ